jgi:hypothetical protein
MLSTIYILLTALGDDEGYLPRVYREAISCVALIATIERTSLEVRKVPENEPALAGGAGGAVGRLRLPQ